MWYRDASISQSNFASKSLVCGVQLVIHLLQLAVYKRIDIRFCTKFSTIISISQSERLISESLVNAFPIL